MEPSDLIQLVDVAISHYSSKLSEMIDDIISSNEEAASVIHEILTQELIKQLYSKTFKEMILSQEQLVVKSPQTDFDINLLELFLDMPGVTYHTRSFRVPYPAGKIISIYINQNPKMRFFSVMKGIHLKPEYTNIQDELVSDHREFLDSSYEQIIEPKKRAQQFLNSLIFANLIKHLQGKLTTTLKEKYVEVFINEIHNQPQRIFYVASLAGLGIYETISIGNNYYLKKLEDHDFDEINEFAVFIKQQEIHLPDLFILKLNPEITSLPDLFKLENYFLTIIRLFAFGEVYISSRAFFVETVIKMGDIRKLTFPHKQPDYTWTLPPQSKDKLTDFATTLLPILKEQLTEDHKPMQFAIERFDWSLRDDLGIERRLLFAVMGLEPLFLPEHSGGKRKKLSQRVSRLLEEFGFEEKDVKKIVKRAYKYRNNIVHGTKYPKTWEKELPKLYPKILNYLRISIIVYLLNLSLGRDEIIKIIIESSTSEAKRKKLKKIISPIKKRFDICFEKNHHALL